MSERTLALGTVVGGGGKLKGSGSQGSGRDAPPPRPAAGQSVSQMLTTSAGTSSTSISAFDVERFDCVFYAHAQGQQRSPGDEAVTSLNHEQLLEALRHLARHVQQGCYRVLPFIKGAWGWLP